MPTLERIQKVIVSGVLGLGLFVMMTAPSVADLSGADREFISKELDKAVKGLKSELQPQIESLKERMDRIERHRPPHARPTPAYPPRRVVHIHRHYYRYWCPPWWY
jgi:hypothetical protein